MILYDLLLCPHIEVPLGKILDPSLLPVSLPSVCECVCMVNAPDEQVAPCMVALEYQTILPSFDQSIIVTHIPDIVIVNL